jgi:heme/copper-type cytochrome/quinol oxidase subunit 2
VTTNLAGIEHTLIWICVGAALVVFAWMLYSVASFRHHERSPLTAEVLWALIPILIVVVSAAPALKSLLPARDVHTDIAAIDNVEAQKLAPPDAAVAKKAFNEGGVPL